MHVDDAGRRCDLRGVRGRGLGRCQPRPPAALTIGPRATHRSARGVPSLEPMTSRRDRRQHRQNHHATTQPPRRSPVSTNTALANVPAALRERVRGARHRPGGCRLRPRPHDRRRRVRPPPGRDRPASPTPLTSPPRSRPPASAASRSPSAAAATARAGHGTTDGGLVIDLSATEGARHRRRRADRLGRDRADGGRVHHGRRRARARDRVRRHRLGRDRRDHARRRDRLPRPQARPDDRQPARGRDRHRRRRAPPARRRRPSRTSSGRSAAAAATSASRPASSSGCTRSGRSSAGMLILPATAGRRSPASSRRPRRRPEELSTIANVMPAPPMPFLPAEPHGKLVILVAVGLRRRPGEGRGALAPFRALADAARRHAAADAATRTSTRPRTATTARWPSSGRCSWTTSTGDVPPTIVERLRPSTRRCGPPSCGCSAARWPACPTTPPRSPIAEPRSWSTSPRCTRSPASRRRPRRMGRGLRRRRSARRTTGAYVSFLGDEGEARSAPPIPARPGTAWPTIKRRYDPDNVFRRNQNIPPAAA